MDPCLLVENEIDKVNSKLKDANGVISHALEDLIHSIKYVQNDLDGKLEKKVFQIFGNGLF